VGAKLIDLENTNREKEAIAQDSLFFSFLREIALQECEG
jgi:hypothetical protein